MAKGANYFSFPTTTVFGPGTIEELSPRLSKLGCRRPLVVTDAGVSGSKAFELLESALGKSGRDRHWKVFHGVHSNPGEQDVIDAAQAFRTGRCDAVICFGGGSPLDVGKACRLMVKRPALRLALFNYEDDWSGLAPCVCIPTTAGTGSEVGRSSVITPAGTQRRAVIFHPKLLADLVILDPELTVDLPAKLTAATGMDALTHCIESFTSPVFHPFCDGVALEGTRIIADALPRAYKNGKDLDARGKMLVAAAMGAVAFQKDLGATHSLAHPLSAMFGVHHGTANAICLPHVMQFNAARKPGLYRRVGAALGLDVYPLKNRDADATTIDFIKHLLVDLGFKKNLAAYGADEQQVDALAREAFLDSCHKTNPVPVTERELKKLYLSAIRQA